MNDDQRLEWARRTFLSRSFAGIGSFALASLLGSRPLNASVSPAAHPWPALPGFPNRVPKAKRIVHLCMAGGPSHVESLDPKPELTRIDGQPFPSSFTARAAAGPIAECPTEGSQVVRRVQEDGANRAWKCPHCFRTLVHWRTICA